MIDANKAAAGGTVAAKSAKRLGLSGFFYQRSNLGLAAVLTAVFGSYLLFVSIPQSASFAVPGNGPQSLGTSIGFNSTDVLAFHRPRLTSPRLLPAARPRLPVESSLRPARSEINATRLRVWVPSFPDHDDHFRERSETSSSAFGSRSRSRRRRLRVRQPQCASSAKGPRAHLVRVVHDAFPRLDET